MEETKLEGVRPGYRAEITPLGSNRVLKGTVDSVAAGVTNASSTSDAKGMATIDSNLEWVRLAQRVPVRIRLDEQQGNLWPAGTTATVVITGKQDRDASGTPSSVNWRTGCANSVNRHGHFLHCQPAHSFCGKAGVRHCAGIIYRLPFSTGDAALGGADRRDRGGRPGICRRRRTLFRRYPLSRNVAYYRDVYWLYRRAYHYYLYDPRAVIDDSGVLCLGRFCTRISSLVRIENSYAWGLSGYTALIIVITIQTEPLLTPQFALERCSEIVIGIGCAILADLLFSPRSIKQEVDRELDSLLVAQYQLMQLCIKHGDSEEVDNARAIWQTHGGAGGDAK